MKKSDIKNMPQFFDRYIKIAEDIDIVQALEKYADLRNFCDPDVLNRLGDQKYAANKWTVKDVLQHIIDNERIQAYRALRFARNDKNSLPGYDEVLFGASANAGRRTVKDLLDEFTAVRLSNIALFKSFDQEMLLREGICFNTTISPLALGFVIVGHQVHHISILKERYFPLLVQEKI